MMIINIREGFLHFISRAALFILLLVGLGGTSLQGVQVWFQARLNPKIRVMRQKRKPRRLQKKVRRKRKKRHFVRARRRPRPAKKRAARRHRPAKKRVSHRRVPKASIGLLRPGAGTPPTTRITIGDAQCQGWQRRIDTQAQLKQPLVTAQFGPQGGGGASCGYHALKNSMVFLQHMADPSIDVCAQVRASQLVQELFGPGGQWRQRVVRHRQERVLEFAIGQALNDLIRPEAQQRYDQLPSLADLYNEGIERREDFKYKIRFNAYKSKLRDIAAQWAREITTDHEQKRIDAQTLVQAIVQSERFSVSMDYFPRPAGFWAGVQWTLQNWRTHVENDVLRLRDRATIEQLFNLAELDQHPRVFSDAPEQLRRAFEQYNRGVAGVGIVRAVQMGPLTGDWANEAELNLIIRDGLARGVNEDNLTVIQDVRNPDEADRMLLEAQAQAIATGRNYAHAFILGTMNVYQGGWGHWFTVVISQRDNRRQVIVADSLNNSLVRSPQVEALLNRLRV